MRSWIGAIVSLASQVTIVQERISSPVYSPSGPLGFQISQSPAKARGSSSTRWMYIGCLAFWSGSFFHSKNPSAGMMQRRRSKGFL